MILDEPTTGLDAFNAHAVVQTLSRLAKEHSKTVIFTIHQVCGVHARGCALGDERRANMDRNVAGGEGGGGTPAVKKAGRAG